MTASVLHQERSVARATRRWAEWTAREDEQVMREDVPLYETAEKLSRTYASCRMRRTLLRKAEAAEAARLADAHK